MILHRTRVALVACRMLDEFSPHLIRFMSGEARRPGVVLVVGQKLQEKLVPDLTIGPELTIKLSSVVAHTHTSADHSNGAFYDTLPKYNRRRR